MAPHSRIRYIGAKYPSEIELTVVGRGKEGRYMRGRLLAYSYDIGARKENSETDRPCRGPGICTETYRETYAAHPASEVGVQSTPRSIPGAVRAHDGLQNVASLGIARAVRRARRAGSTGSVRRVADPFRQAPEIFFDGTATGRFERATAVEMTAVTATGRHDGKTVLEVGLTGNQRRQSARISPSSARTFCTNAFWTLSTPSDPKQTSAQATTTVSIEHFHPYGMKKTNNIELSPNACAELQQHRKSKNDFLQEAVASRPSVTAVPSPIPFRRESVNLDDGTETGRVCLSPNRRNDGRARRRDGAQP
ncbi:hypothetical protein B0H10DRAFT_1950008 [Mycena sp. CBHHK59/15]|nr:hypothetical protein B0H10DRAFT_1950008 [Mycena sp. CBHHK59/15]